MSPSQHRTGPGRQGVGPYLEHEAGGQADVRLWLCAAFGLLWLAALSWGLSLLLRWLFPL
jgi:hypothetical protein